MHTYTLIKSIILASTMLLMANSYAMRGGGDRSVDVSGDVNGRSFDVDANTTRSVEGIPDDGVAMDRTTTINGVNGSVNVNTNTTGAIVAPAARYQLNQDEREYEQGYQ